MLADAGTMRSELVWSTQLGEALQRLSAESFDVILLDLSLADSQGWRTFDKRHGHTAYVPIVVLTGLDDEAVAVRALSSPDLHTKMASSPLWAQRVAFLISLPTLIQIQASLSMTAHVVRD